jgi:hypothetical protein
MSNRDKIYGKGRIEGRWTGIRHELLDSPAWKHTSPGARLLFIALMRRLDFKQYNNGRVFLSTRKAADELGASQRVVCVWFGELEHYGFIEMTEQGSKGPKGRATRWRITDNGWGELDSKPVRATKDYLQWGGELFDRQSKKQKNSEQKYSHRRPKVLTADDRKYSPPPATDDRKCSEGDGIVREQKYSELDTPSPADEAGANRVLLQDWQRNSKWSAERLECPPTLDDGLDIPPFLRRQ